MAAPLSLRRGSTSPPELLSVVVPVHDEQEVLPRFHARLAAVLDELPLAAEIVYVDDGSRDHSGSLLYRFHLADPRVAVLSLSRNFGKEAAMSAGLEHASGDAVVVIDADLQDPPERIVELVGAWRQGYDVVYAQRRSRAGETWFKRASAYLLYRVLHRLARQEIPVDVGDFRLLSRRAVDALNRLPERNRYMKGLFAWIGFPTIGILYDRDPREAGRSHWPLVRLLGLALDGVTAFSWAPLRLATLAGALAAATALAGGAWIVAQTLLWGEPVSGYPSLVCVVLLLGGVQLLAIGIQGEYLGRLFDESKQRPLYLLQSVEPARSPAAARRKTAS